MGKDSECIYDVWKNIKVNKIGEYKMARTENERDRDKQIINLLAKIWEELKKLNINSESKNGK